MSNIITLRVPESLHARARKLAQDDGVSLNQYVQLALAEKLAREEVMQSLDARFDHMQKRLLEKFVERELGYHDFFHEEMEKLNRLAARLERRYG